MSGNTRTANGMVKALKPKTMDQHMKVNGKMEHGMVKGPTHLPMDPSLSMNGKTATHGTVPNTTRMGKYLPPIRMVL